VLCALTLRKLAGPHCSGASGSRNRIETVVHRAEHFRLLDTIDTPALRFKY